MMRGLGFRGAAWLLALVAMTLLLSCGKGKDGHGKRRATSQELRFLRETGINPDTLLLQDMVNYVDLLRERDQHGATWLSAEQLVDLGLDQLIDADSTTMVRLMGVRPMGDRITLLLTQISQDGELNKVLLTTYNADGRPIDMIYAGMFTGRNAAYATSGGAGAMEDALLTFATANFTIERTLVMQPDGAAPLWNISNVDTYQVDSRGHMLHVDGQCTGDAPQPTTTLRRLEALSWRSIQDTTFVAALVELEPQLAAGHDALLGTMLSHRFRHSPWTLTPWVKAHGDAPLARRLKDVARKQGFEKDLDEKLK